MIPETPSSSQDPRFMTKASPLPWGDDAWKSEVRAKIDEGFAAIEAVAVGTGVTSGPPQRSERAELPHSALALSP
jgi:hypothetical protein